MVKLDSTLRGRRQLGGSNTPRPLSQSIVNWAIRCATDNWSRVPAPGFLWRVPFIGSRDFAFSAPKSNVWACDIDTKACAETIDATNIEPRRMWNGDFLAAVDERGFNGKRFDCVVGNPPFVSLHRMKRRQRKGAGDALSRLGVSLDRKASLWAYFVVVAIHSLRKGGRLAMIVPESALHADYARKLLSAVAGHFDCF